MMHISRRIAAAGALLLACTLMAGCGCGKKKEPDANSQEVMKITITPAATPTPAPQEVNPEAVVTNGNLTMVNGYLAGGEAAAQEETEQEVLPQEETENTTSSQEGTPGADGQDNGEESEE